MNAKIIAVLLLPAVLAACSHLPPVAPAAATTATAPAQPTAPPVAPTPPVRPMAPPTPAAAAVPPVPPIPATAPVAAAASKAGNTAVQVKQPAPPKSAPTPPKPAAPIPATAAAPQPPAPPALNLTSLEQRLRDTRAIGVFTKLSLKNQVDDLLDQFRAFYHGKVAFTFPDLRQRYDLLMLKVISLLQDSDRALASDIVASREAIWGVLRDPVKFATI